MRYGHCVRHVSLDILVVVVLIFSCSNTSNAQAIFSFEDGIAPWNSGNGVTLTQSSFGATDGSSALLLDDVTPGYKGNAARTLNFGPETPGMSDAFNAFALAASVINDGGTPFLEFDLTWDFSQSQTIPSDYLQMGLVVNSTTAGGGGYRDYGTGEFLNGYSGFGSWPTLGPEAAADGVSITMLSSNSAHVKIPFGPTKVLNISNPSSFYYLGLQTQGVWTGTVDLAVDNILFTGVPIFEEHTLFSWETPDNPATPGVNEQFEGWMKNPEIQSETQALSITTTGATDGNSALQIDRTIYNDTAFTWEAAFALNSDTDPDPNNEVIDPVIQAEIDDFVTRINGATQVAIDVTYMDQFPLYSPTFTQVWLAFTDETGAYYQAGSASFDIADAQTETTQTLIFDIADFDDFHPTGKNLAVDGLMEGTNAFGIVLGTSTDDGPIFQLDNFRLISEVVSDSADFDNDGDVDGRDFLIWQRGGSPNGINSGDLALWQEQYGMAPPLAAGISVPEPSTVLLTLIANVLLVACGRQKRSQGN